MIRPTTLHTPLFSLPQSSSAALLLSICLATFQNSLKPAADIDASTPWFTKPGGAQDRRLQIVFPVTYSSWIQQGRRGHLGSWSLLDIGRTRAALYEETSCTLGVEHVPIHGCLKFESRSLCPRFVTMYLGGKRATISTASKRAWPRRITATDNPLLFFPSLRPKLRGSSNYKASGC